jgi:putative oxidoreductase
MTFLSRFIEPSYALLRIVSGAIFTFHGVQKIFGILTDHQPPLGSQLWIGGLIELVCGILIVIGYQTRFAAFLSSGTMAVAYFQFHWKFRMGPEFFPAINGGDAAILYCFVFLYIACRGGGIWAFDKSS